jgi:hypothetical protein
MPGLRQAAEEVLQVLVQHRVVGRLVLQLRELLALRELLVDQQPGHLEERALLGELLDRVAGVAQDPALAVEERDRARARARVRVAGVVGDRAGQRAQLADVDRDLALGADEDG